MLHMIETDQESVWKVVKETRKSLLKKDKLNCMRDNTVLSYDNFRENLNIVAQNLNVNKTIEDQPLSNITQESLEPAFQMFTYLNVTYIIV